MPPLKGVGYAAICVGHAMIYNAVVALRGFPCLLGLLVYIPFLSFMYIYTYAPNQFPAKQLSSLGSVDSDLSKSQSLEVLKIP